VTRIIHGRYRRNYSLRHLLHIVRALPEAALSNECAIGGKPPIALAALIDGYLTHVDHHLHQVL